MVIPSINNHPFSLSFNISVDDSSICYYTDVTLEAIPLEYIPPSAVYTWDFGSGSNPTSAIGPGPHVVQYTTTGVKTAECTITYQGIESIETTNITIQNCPGNIVGTIKDLAGIGLASYNMRLYQDFDEDGIADGAAIRSVFSNGSGVWAMASVPVGNYILEQANGSVVQTVSITDTGVGDGIIDPLPLATPPANVLNYAVSIPIRPLQLQSQINVIMNI